MRLCHWYVFVAVALGASSPGPAAVGETVTPPELAIPACQIRPDVDGVLSDPCWAQAAVVNRFHIVGGAETTDAHTARLTTDGAWLYAAFDAALPTDRDALTYKAHDGKLHREEHVSLALDPVGDGKAFYHFWINADNVRGETRFLNGSVWDLWWNIPWKSAAAVRDGRLHGEFAIPLSLVPGGTLAGAKMNLTVRTVTPKRDQNSVKLAAVATDYSWAPVLTVLRKPDRFIPVKGLSRSGTAVFLPMFESTRIGGYECGNGRFGYTFSGRLKNYGAKGGVATVEVVDIPESGAPQSVTTRVSLEARVTQDVALHIPVANLASRRLSFEVRAGEGGELFQKDLKEKMQALGVFSAYVDRNYYTSETSAVCVCSIGLPANFLSDKALAVLGPGGKALAHASSVTRTTRLQVPLGSLPLGDTEVRVLLRDREGARLAEAPLTVTRRTPNPGKEWKIDRENRCLLENGTPFFPFGVLAEIPEDEWYFRDMAALGLNSIVQWSGSRNPDDARRYMELAGKHGLKVIMSPDLIYTYFRDGLQLKDPDKILTPEQLDLLHQRMKNVSLMKMKGVFLSPPFSQLGLPAKRRLYLEYYRNVLPIMERVVEQVKGRDNLIGYFILDEPLLETGEDAVGRAFYKDLNRMDGYRPAFLNYSSGIPPGRRAVDWSDALGADPYWIPAVKGGKGRSSIQFVSRVVAMTDRRAEEVRSMTWTIPMAEYWSGCNRRILTPDEQKCQTYLALIHGTRGIFYFKYPLLSQALHDSLRELAGQMKILGPACMAPAVAQDVAYLPGETDPIRNVFTDVQACLKRNPGGGYLLLAANTAAYPVYTSFVVDGVKTGTKIKRLFAESSFECKHGMFQDRLAPYAVRAYHIDASSLVEPVRITVGMTRVKELEIRETPGYTRYGRTGRKNILPNPSYEEVSVKGWPDYHKKVWGQKKSANAFVGGPESNWGASTDAPWHGKRCLFLKTDGGKDQVIAYTDVEMQLEKPKTWTFSVWLKADVDKTIVDINIGPIVKRVEEQFRISREWARYHLSVPLPQGHQYVGMMVILRKNEKPVTLSIDGLQFEEGEAPTEFEP